MGEKSCLWAKFKLVFWAQVGGFGRETRGETQLRQILRLRRLQSLQSLTLSLSCWSLFLGCLQALPDLLQTVLRFRCSVLHTLHLDFGAWEAANIVGQQVVDDRLAKIAADLVKFEEVELTADMGHSSLCTKHAKELLAAILTALPRESSKLKILTLRGEKDEHAAALAELGGAGVTVNMEPPAAINNEDPDDADDAHRGWAMDHYRSTL